MFTATKEIDIDAAHRVLYHESKCRNLHGHRYTIQATIAASELCQKGSQTGMVMDFSYIKQLMMQFIDAPCDHGTIVWIEDIELLEALMPKWDHNHIAKLKEVGEHIEKFGAWQGKGNFGKLYIVPCVPTAENLAFHWYTLLEERVRMRSNGLATLLRVRVWETRTSFCDYPTIG